MEFAQRHIGPAEPEQDRMLAAIGYESLDDLVAAALPPGLAGQAELALPPPLSEPEALAELRRLAGRNQVLTSMIGLGYYGTVTPAVIRRNLLENPAWYTAYTPYQPEISARPAGGAAQLPDDGRGPDRAAAGRGVDAGRGDRGGRGDDHGQAGGRAGPDLPGRCRLPAAGARRARHQGRAARHRAGDRGSHARAGSGAAGRRAVRGAAALPRGQRGDPGTAPGHRGGACPRRAGGGGGRPAGADAARPAGRVRRGHRGRQHSAVRRADGLRRPARRLHQRPRRAEAPAARPPGRRLAGRGRPARLPACPAGARAAHPPREGDKQHLHGAGPARRHRRHVRRVPRPGRAHRDRAAGAPEGDGAGRRATRARPGSARHAVLRHRTGADA